LLAVPTVVVDSDTGEFLYKLVKTEKQKVAATLMTGAIWEGLLESANLIVEPKAAKRTVVVTAHHDCVQGSPGANDNASGVAVVLRLIGRLEGRILKGIGFRFVLCGAEEPFLVGSRLHVARAIGEGRLETVAACLNFDMVAIGDRFSVRCPKDSVWGQSLTAIGGKSRRGLIIGQTEAMPSSDQWAFHEAGIESGQVTREPDSAWHSPFDAVDRYTSDDLADAEDVGYVLLHEAGERVAQRQKDAR
jgi:aminopeptidase YwaD